MDFSKKILSWYAQNKRDLPWRKTKDPYKIWLSEIMLQQTRVAQGLPYYLKFVKEFPTVQDLAVASEERILKLWQGLGYYSRARNMHTTAKMVVNDFGGKFPNTHKALLGLKGVGDYTASAIASICFDEPQPVVDGNVYRVLARYFGIDLPINSTEGAKYFKELAKEVMDKDGIRDYNQGIMEFGAIQCSPKKPLCLLCPLQDGCTALKENKVLQLPIKNKKIKIRQRYFNYAVLLDNNKDTLMEQRLGKGIWEGLYQFPLVESSNELDDKGILKRINEELKGIDIASVVAHNQKSIVHKLSHQHLWTKFWIVNTKSDLKDGISWSQVEKLPFPF